MAKKSVKMTPVNWRLNETKKYYLQIMKINQLGGRNILWMVELLKRAAAKRNWLAVRL